jgi:hypothetical protein
MPISFAQQYIASWEAKGQDGIEDLLRPNDYIDLTVKIYPIGGQDVTPNNVRMTFPGYALFNSCIKDPIFDYFVCTLEYPSSPTSWDESEISYTVQIFDANNQEIQGEALLGTMYVDLVGPRIDTLVPPVPNGPFFKVEGGSANPISSDGIIDLEYRVWDGIDETPDGRSPCSGVWMVEFYLNNFGGSPIATDEILTTSCTSGVAARKITYTMPSGVTKGTFSICPRTYDNFGNFKDGSCKQFSVDRKGPEIKLLEILGPDEQEIEYFGTGTLEGAIVRTIIEDDDFNPSGGEGTISGRLKEICPDCSEHESGSCESPVDNRTICEWTIDMYIDKSGRKDLYVDVTDAASHSASKKFSKNIKEDLESPEVVSIETSRKVGPNSYIGAAPTTIIATLRETKSGINPEDIKLHLQFYDANLDIKTFDEIYPGVLNPGAGNPKVPLNCTESGNNWLCHWETNFGQNMPFNGTAFAKIEGSDKLGNTIGVNEFDIIVDTVPPGIFIGRDIKRTSVDAAPGIIFSPDKPRAGDIVDFKFNATEDVVFSVNGFRISHEKFPKTGSCTQVTTRRWECMVSVTDLRAEHRIEPVSFNLTDFAGNNFAVEKTVEIYTVEEDVVPTVINDVSASNLVPSFIDKATIGLSSVYLFIDLDINPEPGVTILSRDVGCDTLFLGDERPILYDNNKPSVGYSTEQTLSFKVAAGNFGGSIAPDSIIIPCNMSFTVEKGGSVYTQKEVEEFEIVIPLRDLPFGHIDDTAQTSLNKLLIAIQEHHDTIETLEEWNNFYGILCSIISYVAGIDALLTALILAIQNIACALSVIGVGEGIWAGGCGFINGIHKVVTNAIYDADDWIYPGVPFKIICIVYWGKICSQSFWVQVLGGTIRGLLSNWGRGWNRGGGSGGNSGGTTSAVAIDSITGSFSRKITGAATCLDDELVVDQEDEQTDANTFGGAWGGDRGHTPITITSGNVGADDWLVNPYKSIHYAKDCMYLQGILYNEQKLEQVMCRQYKCYQVAAVAGLPITACNSMFNEMKCLYYDSAEHTILDDSVWDRIFGDWLVEALVVYFLGSWLGADTANLLNAAYTSMETDQEFMDLVEPLDLIQGSLGWLCYVNLNEKRGAADKCAKQSCSQGAQAWCDLNWGIDQVQSLYDMIENEVWDDWGYYDDSLTGTDYCVGIELLDDGD